MQKLKWLFVVLISFVGLIVAYDQGVHNMILENDITYLTWAILLFWLFSSVKLGTRLFQNNWEEWPDLHLAAEHMEKIGMIGTVIGFLYTMTGAFINLNPEDIESFKVVAQYISTGVATALWTTLVGMVCSLNLQVQLSVAET